MAVEIVREFGVNPRFHVAVLYVKEGISRSQGIKFIDRYYRKKIILYYEEEGQTITLTLTF